MFKIVSPASGLGFRFGGTKTMKKLLQTVDSFGPTILRLVLGGVMLMHGLQKTTGNFGGQGFEGTMKMFTETMKIPYALAMAAIVTESVGSACLILGFLTRIWAIGMGILISVAAYKVHLANGFFALQYLQGSPTRERLGRLGLVAPRHLGFAYPGVFCESAVQHELGGT